MGHRVQRIKTDVSEPQMIQSIISAWHDLFGSTPSKDQVMLILAQNNLETGYRKAMWNNNAGNLTTDGNGPFDFFDDLSTNEQTAPGMWNKMNLKYRSYPTLEDGVKDYLRLLSSKHYSQAWQHILQPDPVAFSKGLKAGGYYTADEEQYTKALTNVFNHNQKSDNYQQALSKSTTKPEGEFASIENVIDSFLKSLFASASLKRIYKHTMPNNDIVIQIVSPDYVNAIEFSRVLCNALDEELLATAYPHTDGHQVEIECSIQGPEQECFSAVQQMSNAIVETFQDATKKIGSIPVKTKCLANKKSSYQPISFRTASTAYREFLLKFASKGDHGN
jgi:mannosyl-glycoprotein endo-beta-N-acetylglucosaminidase